MTIEELLELKALVVASFPPCPCEKCGGNEYHRGHCRLRLVWSDRSEEWKEAMNARRDELLVVVAAAKALVVALGTSDSDETLDAIVRLEAAIIELEEVKP